MDVVFQVILPQIGILLFVAMAAFIYYFVGNYIRHKGRVFIQFIELDSTIKTEIHKLASDGSFESEDAGGANMKYVTVPERRFIRQVPFMTIDQFIFVRGQATPGNPLNHKSSATANRLRVVSNEAAATGLFNSMQRFLAKPFELGTIIIILGFLAVGAIGGVNIYLQYESGNKQQLLLNMLGAATASAVPAPGQSPPTAPGPRGGP